jgi:hypothetical protein
METSKKWQEMTSPSFFECPRCMGKFKLMLGEYHDCWLKIGDSDSEYLKFI